MSSSSHSINEKALKKERKKQRKNASQNTWFETSVNGGALILSLLQGAAGKVPVPYLAEAMGYTVSIIKLVQNVRDNRADFQLIAIDAATLVTQIFRSYERSDDKTNWPGPKLEEPLQILVDNLLEIRLFAEARSDNKMVHRVLNKDGDIRKIKEYRIKLTHAMSSFQVVAHLETYELVRLLKESVEDNILGAKSSQTAIQKEREEQERLLELLLAEKHERDRIELAELRRKEEEILRREKESQDIARLKAELRVTELKIKQREYEEEKVRVSIEKLRKEEEAAKKRREAEEDRERLLKAEIALEQARRRRREAAADSTTEEEVASSDEYSSSTEDTEDEMIRLAAEMKAKKTARKSKSRVNKSTQDHLNEAFATAGLSQPPPGYYPPYSPFGPPVFFAPSPYLVPTGSNTMLNSGNLHSSTVSNVSNDYSRGHKTRKSHRP